MGINILIKIQTDQLNKTEKETADTQATTTEADSPNDYSLTENSIVAQNSEPAPTKTTNRPHRKDTPICVHYFGYVSS